MVTDKNTRDEINITIVTSRGGPFHILIHVSDGTFEINVIDVDSIYNTLSISCIFGLFDAFYAILICSFF